MLKNAPFLFKVRHFRAANGRMTLKLADLTKVGGEYHR
jgi:hypothetical protein